MAYRPRIIISMGDPAGIGPEVILRALASRTLRASLRPLVIGDLAVLRREAQRCPGRPRVAPVTAAEPWPEIPGTVPVLPTTVPPQTVRPGRWTAYTGAVSLEAVRQGVRLAQMGTGEALVTAPISKEAWSAAGANVPGHTELLARLTRAPRPAMMFVGGPFRLVLATIHVPLRRVPALLTTAAIVTVTQTAVRELRTRFGLGRPRVAVAGLNPHAGEGGLFGTEERRIIAPAVRRLARGRRLRIEGPLPPDTVFAAARRGDYDLVVCMYHDQGLIPFKLLALHRGVNVTAGLPIIRTSPDHGTAFDLAGTGRADPGSMRAALQTAASMARRVRAR